MIKDSQFRTIRDQYEAELKSLNIPNLTECEIQFPSKYPHYHYVLNSNQHS